MLLSDYQESLIGSAHMHKSPQVDTKCCETTRDTKKNGSKHLKTLHLLNNSVSVKLVEQLAHNKGNPTHMIDYLSRGPYG